MTVQKVSNALIYVVAADTKPTTMATNTLCVVVDTGDIYRWNGSSWVLMIGASVTATLTNKTINATNNTITDTSTAAGDILKSNGTKFARLARGTNNQVLASTSTDIAWTSLNSENAGKATASGNGSTTVFNVAHGLGSTPSNAMIVCSSHTNTFTFTTTTTNIVVTFSTAPPSGTNNVVFYWRAVA